MRDFGWTLLAIVGVVLATPWIGMLAERVSPYIGKVAQTYVDWIWSF